MALYKAVKMEVMILTEATLTDEEIIKWTADAMRDYCDFVSPIVKITEKYDTVLANLETNADA